MLVFSNLARSVGIALGVMVMFLYELSGVAGVCPGPTGPVVRWGSDGFNDPADPGNPNGTSAANVCLTVWSCGVEHCLTLYCDGTVSAWSSENRYGEGDVPAIADVVAIAAGGYHNLALLGDGTVAAWGSDSEGQCEVPAGLSNVVAITAGNGHSVALQRDGTVVAWGGQVEDYGQALVPPDLSNVVAISSAGNCGVHTLALKADGTVVAWGGNAYGQTNVPPGLTNVAAIAAGARSSQALLGDGSPWITVQLRSPRRLRPGSVASLTALAVGAPPLSYQWQRNGEDIPGAANTTLLVGPLQASDAGRYRLVVSNALCFATTAEAGLLLPLPPTPLAEALDATNLNWVTASQNPWFAQTSVATDGSDAAQSGSGDCNSPESWLETTAVGPGSLGFHWKLTSEGGYGRLVFSVDDAETLALSGTVDWQGASAAISPGLHTLRWVYTGGCESPGVEAGWLDQVIFANEGNEVAPMILAQPASQQIALGRDATFSVGVVGYPPPSFQWRFNGTNLAGATNAMLVLPNAQHTDAGLYSAWASNALGSAVSAEAALTIVELPPVISAQPSNQFIHLGGPACFQVTVEGSCPMQYQWRFNGADFPGATNSCLTIAAAQYPQRGQYSVFVRNQFGDTTSSNATLVVLPIAAWQDYAPGGQELVPPDLTNVIAIAAGHTHCLALRSDGTVAAWPNWPASGDLYHAITNGPAGLSNVVAIAAGYEHSLALKADGTVVAWGANDEDQCTVPPGLSNVVGIAAGGYHSLALQAGGTVVAWGDNYSGQATVPDGLSGVAALAGGVLHSVALKSNSTVVAWGWSSPGITNVPADLTNVIAIAASDHTLALKADGTVVGWGPNGAGQTDIPSTLTNAIAIAAGCYHSLALREDGTVIEWGGYSYFPSGLSNVIAIAARSHQSLALIGPATDPHPRLAHPRLGRPVWAGTTLGITLPTLQGKRYILEYITSLTDTNWTPLAAMQGLGYGFEQTLTDPSASSTQRFYRVRVE